jgi:hypothetical protein
MDIEANHDTTRTAYRTNTSPEVIDEEYQGLVEDHEDAEKYFQMPYPTPAEIKKLKRELQELSKLHTHKFIFDASTGVVWCVGLLPNGTIIWKDKTFVLQLEKDLDSDQFYAALAKALSEEIIAKMLRDDNVTSKVKNVLKRLCS